MDLKTGYVCDRGLNPKRPVNQDRFLAIPERGLFAVFDGVGGQRAGEVASQTAAETIEETFAHSSNNHSSVELIRQAIDFANRDIFEMAENDPAFKTMATTVALIQIEGKRATVAHVGDSRVYRLENGRFHLETVDHTDLNDDIRAGRIAKDQAAVLVDRNVINRALGVESVVDIEIKSINVGDGARFLLCSDGIYRHMSDQDIARVLAEHKDPQRAADELKRIVHQRGAEDNLTAVVVQVGRARQSSVVTIDDETPGRTDALDKQARGASIGGSARGNRINVDFDRQYASPRSSFSDQPERRSASRVMMYVLLVLVLVGAAFYGGLRASDVIKQRGLERNATRGNESLASGREAFERGDFKMAAVEFDSAVKREPSNAQALYWLGRAQLEQRDYAGAVKNFEEATARQPSLLDAYPYLAAAWESMGERAKANAALTRYVEERRKQSTAVSQ